MDPRLHGGRKRDRGKDFLVFLSPQRWESSVFLSPRRRGSISQSLPGIKRRGPSEVNSSGQAVQDSTVKTLYNVGLFFEIYTLYFFSSS